MPFITQDRREIIDSEGLGKLDVLQVGDLCYAFYKPMVKRWKAHPRWTTAHDIYRDMIAQSRDRGLQSRAAQHLAWQVFFQLHVMPYELQKRQEKGDINE